MEKEYKDIVDRRKKLIQKNLKWTSDFSSALKKSKLVDKTTLKDIEDELADEAKTVELLGILRKSKVPGAFNIFCEVLRIANEPTLHKTMTDDRYRIVWDFQTEGHASNFADYLSVVEDQLFKRYDREDDEYMRGLIWDELCSRILKVKSKLRRQQQERQVLRQEIISACPNADRIEQLLPDGPKASTKANLLQDDADIRADRVVSREARSVIAALVKKNKALEAELDAQQATERREVMGALKDSKAVNSTQKLKDKVDVMDRMIQDYDMKVVRLQDEQYALQKHNVVIRRTEMFTLFDLLQSYMPKHRRCTEVEDHDVTKVVRKHAGGLLKELQQAKETADIHKKRIGQMSNRVSELELEREATAKMLGLHSSSAETLQDGLCENLNLVEELREKVDSLEDEMQSMEKRMATLAAENLAIGVKAMEKRDLNGEAAGGRRSSISGMASPTGRKTNGVLSPKPGPRRASVTSMVPPSASWQTSLRKTSSKPAQAAGPMKARRSSISTP